MFQTSNLCICRVCDRSSSRPRKTSHGVSCSVTCAHSSRRHAPVKKWPGARTSSTTSRTLSAESGAGNEGSDGRNRSTGSPHGTGKTAQAPRFSRFPGTDAIIVDFAGYSGPAVCDGGVLPVGAGFGLLAVSVESRKGEAGTTRPSKAKRRIQQPLPPTPSPRRRGEKDLLLPLSASGRGWGEGFGNSFQGDGDEESARAGSERVGRLARGGTCRGEEHAPRHAVPGSGCRGPRRPRRVCDVRADHLGGTRSGRLSSRTESAVPAPHSPVGYLPSPVLRPLWRVRRLRVLRCVRPRWRPLLQPTPVCVLPPPLLLLRPRPSLPGRLQDLGRPLAAGLCRPQRPGRRYLHR